MKNVLTLLLCLGLMFCVVIFFMPFFSTWHHHRPQLTTCQSNLKQIGTALNMYTQDWGGKYPINARVMPDGKAHNSSFVLLKDVTPIKSVSFVNALNKYIQKQSGKDTGTEIWQCPEAMKNSPETAESDPDICATYGMNFSLLGSVEEKVANPAYTLLMRELGVPSHSVAIADYSGPKPLKKPSNIFFGKNSYPQHGPTLHGEVSNLLFVDGHVQVIKMNSVADNKVANIGTKTNPKWALVRPNKEVYIYVTP